MVETLDHLKACNVSQKPREGAGYVTERIALLGYPGLAEGLAGLLSGRQIDALVVRVLSDTGLRVAGSM